jgi:branched-chain amino acid aminotransferase
MSLVWFEDAIYKRGDINLSPFNRGLMLGDGLFETVLCVGGKALWQDAHFARMEASSKVLGLAFPKDVLRTALEEMQLACGLDAHVLRMTLTRGTTSRSLGDDGGEPVVLATADRFDKSLIGKPVTLATASIRRNANSFASNHKSLSYVDSVVATREAEAKESEGALMLNEMENVASTAIGNLFLLRGHELVTPSVDQGILPGITRAIVLNLAAQLGLRSNQRAVERQELFVADAVFQTNSLRLLSPIRRLDNRVLGQRDCTFILEAVVDEARKCFDVEIPIQNRGESS